MKKRMNPVKKYANGTGTNGVGPNNYIPSPNEVMSDYNIMLAKADLEVANNKLVPIVSLVGGLMQQGVGMAGKASMAKGGGGKFEVGGGFDETNKNIDVDAINNFNFSSSAGATLNRGVTAANGMNDVQEDVEVEGGEMYETPQGETGEFQGPVHEQGGIPMEVGKDIPEGTKVYSDRLKVGDKTLADRKDAREKKIANLEKIASDPLVDSALKNATKRKMEAIQKEEAADLQFQEQVNNMQAMADTMVKAFGTGMQGVQKMALGGIVGDPREPKYDKKGNLTYPPNSFEIVEPEIIREPKYDKAGNLTYPSSQQNLLSLQEDDPNYMGSEKFVGERAKPLPALVPTPGMNINLRDSLPSLIGMPNTEDSTAEKSEESKLSKYMTMAGEGMPAMGDLVGLFENYLGATSGLKNAAEQRSTDVTHRNVHANAGKESQKMLDNAKSSIEGAKAQAMIKANTTSTGGKKSGRNSARGINQKRGMDWLYDTALQQQLAEISTNAANQVSQIDIQKSGVAMNADQLRGFGEHQAAMANEAAKDAYYTAKGLGLKDQSLGIQYMGENLNDMKENKIFENMLKDDGEHVTINSKGKMSGRKAKTKNKSSNTFQVKDPATGKMVSLSVEQIQKLINNQ
jgi:hypothetical protein